MTKSGSLLAASALCAALVSSSFAQVATPTPAPASDDVVRISSELIQTGVSVTNKKGEFVTGLKLEDFQLLVDGRPVTPQFFEPVRISGGTTASYTYGGKPVPGRTTAQLTDVVRTMVFLVDDLHMSAESLIRTRRVLQRFVENELLPSDRIAIVASSGSVGFLQQFTSDKDVLLKACERLVFSQKRADEAGPPPMTEFDAQALDRRDQELTSYFIRETLRYNPGMTRQQAFYVIQARMRGVLNNTRVFTQNTLGAIEASVVQAGKFPGRKALYYFSDGMLLDPGNTNTPDQLRKITSAAARANVVMYTFDARGLDTFMAPATVDSPKMDSDSMSLRAAEAFERQDALAYLANKTGGRFVHNTNDIKGNLSVVTAEAFQYYLLAWEPTDVDAGKFRRIEIKVPSRPDLTLSYQTGYLDRPSGPKAAEPTAAQPANAGHSAPQTTTEPVAIPAGQMPVHLTLSYLQLGNEGPSLSATIEVDSAMVTFDKQGNDEVADLEFTVVLFDQDGKQQTAFMAPMRVSAPAGTIGPRSNYIRYEYRTILKPGLYQMRVRSRDQRSAQTGAVAAWLEIPSPSKISVSSLMLGELVASAQKGDRLLDRNVHHRFSRDVSLQFLGFIYTVGKSINRQKLEIRAEVLQANKVFITRSAALTHLVPGDDRRIPFTGNLPLESLAPGHYELLVTIIGAGDKPLVRRSYFEVR